MATSSTASEVAKRKDHGLGLYSSPADRLGDFFLSRASSVGRVRFPSDRYRQDPVAFAREIIGVEPWYKQVEILNSVRDHKRVAVKSGHKCSKSHSAAIIASWFYCSFDDARVVMTSTTARQVDQILWRELKMLRSRSGKCVDCKRLEAEAKERGELLIIDAPCQHSAFVDGDMGELARTGLKSGFREVVGFTAREAEAVAGISGKNLLYIIDEASGVPDVIFEAIEGNRAGGARIVMFSNPTRNEGEFYDAFNSKARFYCGITLSSEMTPNVVEGRDVIPGLAGLSWIEEKREEWGENSSLYKIRVKGEFAEHEEGKIFSIHDIEQAEQRWAEASEAGRLYIGLDPAGESGTGDESAFCVRRGQKVLALTTMRGLNEDSHLVQLLAMIMRHKVRGETPVVIVDAEGAVGSKVWIAIRDYADAHKGELEAVAIRASDKAHRQAHIFDRQRDVLTANLEAWLREGGAIVEDVKLEKELHSLEWKQQANGRLKVTPKDILKKVLGRSPDRYDALCLATWEPLSLQDDLPSSVQQQQSRTGGHEEFAAASLDPYSGANAWRGPRR